ncbi:alpha/beta fold hydrolase [Aurantibacter sp.]|uniref:alpha/beta fold hydrolase n=1 Tax=Aurantibacter sp. TaxID=2807103 RepID=UPI0035C7B947
MILEHKSAKIFYSVTGTGEPVVLLHGFLESSTMWDNLIEDLSEKNQVITIDLLGHGQTDCLGYVHTMTDFANAVNTVLNHLKISTFKIIGHSLGGYIALALAELNPNAIKSLCLMNSTTEADSKDRIDLRNRAIKTAKKQYTGLVSMSISNLFFEENRKTFANKIEALKIEALKTPVQGYIAAQEGMKIRPNQTEFFKTAKFNKYIIAGKKDPVLDFETIKNISLRCNATFIGLKGGHMSQIEDLADLKPALLQFVNN